MKKYILELGLFLLLAPIFIAGCSGNPKTIIVDKAVEIDYELSPEEILLDYTSEGVLAFKRHFPDTEIMNFAVKNVGKKASNFKYTDVLGSKVSLSDYKGKKLILSIMKNTCSVCQQDVSMVREVVSEYDDVSFLSIFPKNTNAEIKKFYSYAGITLSEDIISGEDNADMTIVSDYGLTAVPTYLFIDEDGRVSYIHVGSTDKENFRDYIEYAFGKAKLYDNVITHKVEVPAK